MRNETAISRRDLVAGTIAGTAATGLLGIARSAQAEDAIPDTDHDVAWDGEYDVVVLGLGGAGANAAVAAYEEGVKVLVCEKAPEGQEPCNTKASGQFVIATDDGSVGFHGTSVQAFMQDVDEIRPDVVLACGPTPMLRALKTAVKGRDIPVYVSLEERMGCGIGACLVCVCDKTDGAHARVCKDGPVFEIGDVVL